MTPDTLGKLAPGKKRKFLTYSLNQQIVSFKVNARYFSIHSTLLNEYSSNRDWRSDLCITHFKFDDHCLNCPHDVEGVSTDVFRGFMHWLYYQELPDEGLIESFSHPSERIRRDQIQDLACSMAIELYVFGQQFGFKKLTDEAMTFIFLHYKSIGNVPLFSRVEEIFDIDSKFSSLPLKRFCVDIYYKWCTYPSAYSFPAEFLDLFFEVQCKRNKGHFEGKHEDEFVLRLCNYHDDNAREDCECGKWNEEAYIIKGKPAARTTIIKYKAAKSS